MEFEHRHTASCGGLQCGYSDFEPKKKTGFQPDEVAMWVLALCTLAVAVAGTVRAVEWIV